MYDVTMRRVRASLLPVKRARCGYVLNGYPGVWACACAYAHVALLVYQAKNMRHVVTSFVAPKSPPGFST
jgi:hypothetical protein